MNDEQKAFWLKISQWLLIPEALLFLSVVLIDPNKHPIVVRFQNAALFCSQIIHMNFCQPKTLLVSFLFIIFLAHALISGTYLMNEQEIAEANKNE